jgi:hypothetical protein
MSDKKFNKVLIAKKKEIPDILKQHMQGRLETTVNTIIRESDAIKLASADINKLVSDRKLILIDAANNIYETRDNVQFIELERNGLGNISSRMMVIIENTISKLIKY